MTANLESKIESTAEACVDSMGDVFWDFVPDRDHPLGFRPPQTVAVDAVRGALWRFASDLEGASLCPTLLRAEYQQLVGTLDPENDEAIITALIAQADWTLRGSVEVLGLAREYGTSILRNALALAEALRVEDGSRGL